MDYVPLTPHDAFRHSEDEFRDRVSTLCLLPIQSEVSVDGREKTLGDLEAQMKLRLTSAGFEVVTSAEVRAQWGEAREVFGGYYDPITGRRLEDQYLAFRERFFAEIQNKWSCDALVSPRIVVVWAALDRSKATWDGAIEPAYGYMGHMGAVSIWISMSGAAGKEIYFGAGAVELTSRIELPAFSSPYFVPLKSDELLTDRDKYLRGVDRALQALVNDVALR